MVITIIYSMVYTILGLTIYPYTHGRELQRMFKVLNLCISKKTLGVFFYLLGSLFDDAFEDVGMFGSQFGENLSINFNFFVTQRFDKSTIVYA